VPKCVYTFQNAERSFGCCCRGWHCKQNFQYTIYIRILSRGQPVDNQWTTKSCQSTGSKHQGLLVPRSLVKQVNGLFGENKDPFLA
jgi:hypothetical protein